MWHVPDWTDVPLSMTTCVLCSGVSTYLLLWCPACTFAPLHGRRPPGCHFSGVSGERRGRPVVKFAIVSDPLLLHSALRLALSLSSEPFLAAELLSASSEAEDGLKSKAALPLPAACSSASCVCSPVASLVSFCSAAGPRELLH